MLLPLTTLCSMVKANWGFGSRGENSNCKILNIRNHKSLNVPKQGYQISLALKVTFCQKLRYLGEMSH